MSKEIQQVAEFMNTFGQPVRTEQQLTLARMEIQLRINLILEEVQELCHSLGYHMDAIVAPFKLGDTPVIDRKAALDALTDIRYVVYGTYHSLGLADVADVAFDEVHNSNMSKGVVINGVVTAQLNEAGKIIKGPNYVAPNLAQFITKGDA